MAILEAKFSASTPQNLELALSLIAQNKMTGCATFVPTFSKATSDQLVTEIFKKGKGLAPIEVGYMGNPVGFFHLLNLKIALFNISDNPDLPENIRGALRESTSYYNSEVVIGNQSDIGLFSKVIDRERHADILKDQSYDLSPKAVVPSLMGVGWESVPAGQKFDYWSGKQKPLVQEFLETHTIITTALPLETQFDQKLMELLTGNENFTKVLKLIEKGKKPKDLKPADFDLNASQSDLEMVLYLISSAYLKAATEVVTSGGADAKDLLIKYLKEISLNTKIVLEEQLKQDIDKELVVMFAYNKQQ